MGTSPNVHHCFRSFPFLSAPPPRPPTESSLKTAATHPYISHYLASVCVVYGHLDGFDLLRVYIRSLWLARLCLANFPQDCVHPDENLAVFDPCGFSARFKTADPSTRFRPGGHSRYRPIRSGSPQTFDQNNGSGRSKWLRRKIYIIASSAEIFEMSGAVR